MNRWILYPIAILFVFCLNLVVCILWWFGGTIDFAINLYEREEE